MEVSTVALFQFSIFIFLYWFSPCKLVIVFKRWVRLYFQIGGGLKRVYTLRTTLCLFPELEFTFTTLALQQTFKQMDTTFATVGGYESVDSNFILDVDYESDDVNVITSLTRTNYL